MATLNKSAKTAFARSRETAITAGRIAKSAAITALKAGASAAVIAGCALAGSVGAWRAVTGWGIYALMLLVSGLEFFVRKTWFRYYFHGGPFDRLWSGLFPPENTEQGRRSAAYIRRCREEMAGSTRARG